MFSCFSFAAATDSAEVSSGTSSDKGAFSLPSMTRSVA